MKLRLALFMSCISAIVAQAQVAIINDPDGYTNVRAAPSIEADIVYQVKSNELFFYFYEFDIDGVWYAVDDSSVQWIEVELPPNRFSQFTNHTTIQTGYMHKSRLLPLESLEQIPNENAYLIFDIIPGLEREKDSSSTNSQWYISGKIPFGLEAGLSRSTAVASCMLIVEQDTITLDGNLVDDLFNVSPDVGYFSTLDNNRCSVFKQGNFIYIYQQCGDGAGYYEIVWRIKGNQIVQRLAGWMY